MANFIPGFLNGSKVAIRMGNIEIAFAQNVSFSDDMSVAPVGQIGSYNIQALEPTNYIARGSMTITNYSNLVLSNLSKITDGVGPAGAIANTNDVNRDGNSMLHKNFFSPASLMISKTFDLDFYERSPVVDASGNVTTIPNGKFIYRLSNVRLTNYSIGFTPGSMVNETVAFIATSLEDSRAGETTKVE